MFGEKTNRLEKLSQTGFTVPPFVGISTSEIENDPEDLAKKVLKQLSGKSFAVRSSALVEDALNSSMAGQFLTKLNVPRSKIGKAIEEVRADAKEKLGKLAEFSIIVQEFIEADFSGVTFTRAPYGGRETIVEYHAGRGDAVVSGEVKPERIVYFRTQDKVESKLPEFDQARAKFLAIEQLFGFPQDIEWCVKDNNWYILQSRPITSITSEHATALDVLERELPVGKYYFAKTEVCDVAPRPSSHTFELLIDMYATDGPVDLAYRTLGVTYSDTEFLQLFGGELYVDKEKELQSLFPSHSYFGSQNYVIKPQRLKGFLTSLRNTGRLQKIRGDVEKASSDLQERLSQPLHSKSISAAKKAFFEDYEAIFSVNLFAERALDALKRALPKDISLTEALQYFPNDLPPVWKSPTDIIGNTFELTDASPFISLVTRPASAEIPSAIPLKQLREAQLFLRLREYGRWLALRHISHIRSLRDQTSSSVSKQSHEVASGSRRRDPRNDGSHYSTTFSLPSVITDTSLLQDNKKPLGVSSGRAEGKLVTTPEEGGILVVSSLTPDIAHHAKILKGVIADHGGLLSHFAIIAREMGLPVVVNYPIHELPIGKMVSINGSTGEIKVL